MAKNNIKNDAITPRDVDFAKSRINGLLKCKRIHYLSPIWLCIMGTDSELYG